MLVNCIRERIYLYGSSDSDLLQCDEQGHSRDMDLARGRHAPKITKEDSFIDWKTMTAAEILQRHEIVGPLWNTVESKRVIWSAGFELSPQIPVIDMLVGQPIMRGSDRGIYIRTCDDQLFQIHRLKIEGGVELEPLRAANKAGMHEPRHSEHSPLFRFPVS